MFNKGDFMRCLAGAGRDGGDSRLPRSLPFARGGAEDSDEKGLAKTFLRTTLAEHDRRFHPNGYRDGDRCNFREAMRRGDSVDALADAERKEGDVRLALVKVAEDPETGERKVVGFEEVGSAAKPDAPADKVMA